MHLQYCSFDLTGNPYQPYALFALVLWAFTPDE